MTRTAPAGRRQALARLLLAAPGWLAAPLAARGAPVAIGERVQWPERLALLDGPVLRGESIGDEGVLVVFFSTTCPFCQRHNRHLERLRRRMAGQPLRILGVAHDREPGLVREYLARNGLGFQVTLDQQPLHEALSLRRVIPLTCVVDRRGRLREVIPGEMFEEDVMELQRWADA
jgi:peroxiredoxin